MSENHPQTAAELNEQTNSALTAKAAEAANPVKIARKPTAKKTAKPAVTVKAGRRSLTPKERAARPVTATIDSYLTWLEKNVLVRKMSGPERKMAGIAITLYGNYQISPERRAARLGK